MSVSDGKRRGKTGQADLGSAILNNCCRLWGGGLSLAVWYLAVGSLGPPDRGSEWNAQSRMGLGMSSGLIEKCACRPVVLYLETVNVKVSESRK